MRQKCSSFSKLCSVKNIYTVVYNNKDTFKIFYILSLSIKLKLKFHWTKYILNILFRIQWFINVIGYSDIKIKKYTFGIGSPPPSPPHLLEIFYVIFTLYVQFLFCYVDLEPTFYNLFLAIYSILFVSILFVSILFVSILFQCYQYFSRFR